MREVSIKTFVQAKIGHCSDRYGSPFSQVPERPLLARLGPTDFADKLPLIGVKRTRRRYVSTAEFDPNRKSFVDDDATT